MSDKPNILYIFTDQQYAGAMSCAGDAELHTPAMDTLCETGTRFERTYCTQPLCSPSRASMFTGVTPHEAGVPKNGLVIDERWREQELGVLLQRAGYECAYGGKWHIPHISLDEGHGFDRISPFGDRDLADACIRFLEGKHERPFFLVASFDNPHNICEWARQQPLPWGPIPDPPSLEACPNLPANFAIPPYEPEAIRVEQASHRRIYPSVSFNEDDWRRYRWAYYRLVEKADAEIGRILEALRRGGLEKDTLVVFSSDHGDGHAAHRWSQKSALYEEEVRVPLIVSMPGVTRSAVNSTHLVSNGLDLLPTLADYAGACAPEGLSGRSLRGLAEGREPDSWRDHVVVETLFDGGRGYDTQGRSIITSQYKYTIYDWGKNREQLFDLSSDPGETTDLSVESRHRATQERLRRLLAERCAATSDRFRMPES